MDNDDNGDTDEDKTSNEIESTVRFKYIRSLEMLQLVYIMRIEESADIIFRISIIQSILSMTNSMLNSDNTYMAREKFKKHRRRFPPTKEFLQQTTILVWILYPLYFTLWFVWQRCDTSLLL